MEPREEEDDGEGWKGRNHKFRQPDDEEPDLRDVAGDEIEMVRCPFCRKWMPETSPKCPYCRNWVDAEREARKPRWFVITAIVCLAMAIMWAIFG